MLQQCLPVGSSGEANAARSGYRVHSTGSADAAVAQEYLLAQVGWLRTKLPLMDTVFRAEGEAAPGHLQ
ncbi:MAG TPA: hypothetical protein VFB43_14770 [Terracidiphilus sp.]|nr:hypothetical protein [Terracidiphilus sp.]